MEPALTLVLSFLRWWHDGTASATFRGPDGRCGTDLRYDRCGKTFAQAYDRTPARGSRDRYCR
ncbi:hypothetical protein Athai_00970 [Actinocatenispora thailandica]|uniref:Uncharacterized protein n=1 Tax=Actinocatenispora thailandica TaxID=227318 RepID=A0A7R7DJ27_9ACTN|nr:hypothetical protein Athai_00970 [Actinocatenispora thailandica]